MKRKNRPVNPDMVFMPALLPFEAAVLPAQAARRDQNACGALRCARESFDRAVWPQRARDDQRAKICVR